MKYYGRISDPKDLCTKEYVDGGKPLAFTVTLTTAGWSNYAQTVNNANFVANGYGYIVTPAPGSVLDYSEAAIYADNVMTNGQMTFHCLGVPSIALTVNILRMEVT